MTKETFETYRFGAKTEVKHRGEWSGINEVWFNEGKIGITETGHLEDYSQIEDIRN